MVAVPVDTLAAETTLSGTGRVVGEAVGRRVRAIPAPITSDSLIGPNSWSHNSREYG